MRFSLMLVLASLGASAAAAGEDLPIRARPSVAAKLGEALESILAVPSPAGPQNEPSGDVTVDFSSHGKALAVLAEAQSAEQERNWRRAAELYQRLLDDAPSELCMGSPRLYVPMRAYVEERLAGFPPEGLRAYRGQVDAEAAALYAAALASSNPQDRLADVAGRFLLSSSGDDALDRLAASLLERGQPGRALRAWRRLLRLCPDTDVPPAPLAARLAVCLDQLRHPEAARAFLASAQKALGQGASLAVAGRPTDLAAFAAMLPRPPAAPGDDGWWPVPGGAASHARVAPDPIRPGALAWSDLISSMAAARALTAWRARAELDIDSTSGEPSVRVLPVVADRSAIYPTRSGILARDVDTGKLMWEWPWPLDGGPWRVNDPFTVPSFFVGHWSCSASDDAVLCAVPFQVGARHGNLDMAGNLVALDRRSGSVRWQRAASDVFPPEQAEGAWFVCAPLPCGQRLLVGTRGGVGSDEYHLCCLRSRDGATLWRTFLGSRPSSPLYRLSRYQPWFEGMPAESRGLAVACPGGGVLAAVELATGSVRWLARYDQSTGRRRGRRWFQPDGWRTWSPVVVGGVVYATPPDADYLYAVDLDSGQTLWRHDRANHRYLAAVHDGKAYLVGDAATCLGPTGQVEWEMELPSPAVGRPVVAGRVLHVPLAGGLLFLDTSTGGELAWTSWDAWTAAQGATWSAHIASGDLLAAGGKLFVATPYSLNAFAPVARRDAAERRVAANPDDPSAHYALGQESHWEGNVAAAAEAFEKALELAARKPGSLDAPALADVRRRLAMCYHDVMRRQQQAGRPDLALAACNAALRYAAGGPERAELQLRAAALATGLRRTPDAVAAYQDVLANARPATPDWQAARSGLDALLHQAGREAYAPFDRAAAAALQRGAEADLLAIVERYPNSLSAPAALGRLAALADAAGRADDARLWLHRLVREHADSPQAPQALHQLATRYARDGAAAMARGAVERLHRRYPNWQEATPDVVSQPDAAPLKLPLTVQWDTRPTYGAASLELAGRNAGKPDVFFALAGRSFECRSALDGALKWADRPGWIGVRIMDAERRGGGVRIVSTVADTFDTPAERAGLRGGDIIVSFDNRPIRDCQDLITTCMDRRGNSTIRLGFVRDEELRVVGLKLGERPSLADDVDLPAVAFVGAAGSYALLRKSTRLDGIAIESGDVAWSCPIEGPPGPDDATGGRLAAVAPGIAALADSRARIAALDPATGRGLWSLQLDEPATHSVALWDHGLVLTSSRPATLRVVNPLDGEALFHAAERHALTPPLVSLDTGGRLCYAMGSTVGCYDARRHRALWSTQIVNFAAKRLWVAGPLVMALGVDRQGLDAIECRKLETGDPVWSLALGRGEHATLGHAMPDAFYLVTRRAASTTVRRLDGSTGHVAWAYEPQRDEELAAWDTSAAALVLGLSLGDANGVRRSDVVALDWLTGAEQQRLTAGQGALRSLTRLGAALYAVIEDDARTVEPPQWMAADVPAQPARFRIVRIVGAP